MIKQSIQRVRFLLRTLSARKLDALDQLEGDHIRTEILFLLLRMSDEAEERREVMDRIRSEILIHSEIEEKFFYPACLHVPKLKGRVSKFLGDHRRMKELLVEAYRNPARAEARFKLLSEDVDRHVAKEETELFPEIRKFMAPAKLEELGASIRAYRLEAKRLRRERRLAA